MTMSEMLKRLKKPGAWIFLSLTLAGLVYWECTQLSDYCSDGHKYMPGSEFCYPEYPDPESRAYPLCGGLRYDPPTQGCPHGDVILPRCGQNFYYEDEACYTDPETGVQRIHKRCAGVFDPVEWTCDDVPLDPICDGKVYNPDVDFCFNNVPQMKCGGVTGYDPNTQFCGGDNRVYEKCGGEEYDPRYPSPCAAVADTRPMCGEERYDAGVQFCRDERLYVLCDGREYEPAAGETCYNEIRGPEVTPDATYALAVAVDPPGAGEVAIEPNRAVYEDGEPVTVSAVASEGYRFTGWTGSLESAEATMAFNMTRNMSLTANFAEDAEVPPVVTPPIGEGDTAMVFVQGGTFTMGCTAGDTQCYSNESPTSSVTVSDFYIGQYEVTQRLWTSVMGSNPSADCGSYGSGDNYPVYCVSWDDVQDFLVALNQQTGRTYRLPTEAEWEYAARGGTQSRGHIYSGSDNIDEVAWYWENSDDGTKPVGTKQPNELGIYDMSGNVWEWVNDWYGDYTADAKTDPQGPATGSYRVGRGGSWNYVAEYCRVSNRGSINPDYRSYYIGFRLVLSSPP
jgi:uncharacterized repeat protein (TIGR02543 family)